MLGLWLVWSCSDLGHQISVANSCELIYANPSFMNKMTLYYSHLHFQAPLIFLSHLLLWLLSFHRRRCDIVVWLRFEQSSLSPLFLYIDWLTASGWIAICWKRKLLCWMLGNTSFFGNGKNSLRVALMQSPLRRTITLGFPLSLWPISLRNLTV